MKVGEKLMVRMDPPFSITWLVNGLCAICHVPRIDNLTSRKYIVYGHDSKNCNFSIPLKSLLDLHPKVETLIY